MSERFTLKAVELIPHLCEDRSNVSDDAWLDGLLAGRNDDAKESGKDQYWLSSAFAGDTHAVENAWNAGYDHSRSPEFFELLDDVVQRYTGSCKAA